MEKQFYVLNSAVITGFGTFKYEPMTVIQAGAWLAKNDWHSTIGYPETCQVFNQMFGTSIIANREQVKLEVSDEALVFRLNKRLDDIQSKGQVGIETVKKYLEIGKLTRIGGI
jgi:hypothetical protein